MVPYFAVDYTGDSFQFLGAAHLWALLLIFALNLFLYHYKYSNETTRNHLRIGMAVILWLNETSYHLWNITHGLWNIHEHLPLHLCSVFVWLAGFMLIFKNYSLYEFIYFLGIGGATQALLTPDLGIYGFPHFRFFQTYISHGLLATSAIYMTLVEGFRPTWKSLVKVTVIMNLYMLLIYFVNQIISSNYLYIAHKPPGPTLLDVLPEWPGYILYIEAIGIAISLLLYLPFALHDRQRKIAGNLP